MNFICGNLLVPISAVLGLAASVNLPDIILAPQQKQLNAGVLACNLFFTITWPGNIALRASFFAQLKAWKTANFLFAHDLY